MAAFRPSVTAPYTDGGGTPNDDAYYNESKYVIELYSKKVLKNFYKSTIYNECFNTDYEGEIKGQGAKVHIRKTPTITVRDYTIGAALTYEVPHADATELLIDQGIYSAFQVDDVNKAQADIELISMFANDAAMRMKIKVDNEVLSYVSTRSHASNKGATAGAISGSVNLGLIDGAGASIDITADNAIEYLVDLNMVLDEANQPSEGRWVVLPAWFCALLKKGDLRSADITGDSTGVIRNGLIGMVDRFKVYMSNNLLTANDGDAETSWYVLAGTKEACTFAAQVDKVDTLKIPTSFGEYWRTLMVYGRAVVQPTALSTLICKRG